MCIVSSQRLLVSVFFRLRHRGQRHVRVEFCEFSQQYCYIDIARRLADIQREHCRLPRHLLLERHNWQRSLPMEVGIDHFRRCHFGPIPSLSKRQHSERLLCEAASALVVRPRHLTDVSRQLRSQHSNHDLYSNGLQRRALCLSLSSVLFPLRHVLRLHCQLSMCLVFRYSNLSECDFLQSPRLSREQYHDHLSLQYVHDSRMRRVHSEFRLPMVLSKQSWQLCLGGTVRWHLIH